MNTAAKKRNSLASSVLASMVVLVSTLLLNSAAIASSVSASLLGIAPSIDRTVTTIASRHDVVALKTRVEIFLCSAAKSIERSELNPTNATRYYDALEGVALECLVAPISGLGSLSRAGQYGIQPYNSLTKLLKGSGLQAHHLLEQRFAGVLGVGPRSMSSIAVSPAEHQIFTNAWRQLIPYGQGTANATREQIMNAARIIYKDYPDILKALGL